MRKPYRVLYWVLLSATIAVIAYGWAMGFILWFGPPGLVALTLIMIDAKRQKMVGTLIALTAFVSVATTVAGAAIIFEQGINDGYTYEVVARESFTVDQFESIEFARGDQICGGGQDYRDCVTMHIAMFNSVCVTPRSPFVTPVLGASAQDECQQLSEFIEDARSRLDGCGNGCTTLANESGTWGWPYLVAQPQLDPTVIRDVVYTAQCWFVLGDWKMGDCT